MQLIVGVVKRRDDVRGRELHVRNPFSEADEDDDGCRGGADRNDEVLRRRPAMTSSNDMKLTVPEWRQTGRTHGGRLSDDARAKTIPYTNHITRNYCPFLRSDFSQNEQLASCSNYETINDLLVFFVTKFR